MSKPRPTDEDVFDPWKAATWNAHEHAVYETGYAEGGRNNAADWAIALEELTDIEDEWAHPWEVAAYIAKLEAQVALIPVPLEEQKQP